MTNKDEEIVRSLFSYSTKNDVSVTNRAAIRAAAQKAFIAASNKTTIAAAGNFRVTFQNPAGSGINVVVLALVTSNNASASTFASVYLNPTTNLPVTAKTPFNAVLGAGASVALLKADSDLSLALFGGTKLLDLYVKANERQVFAFPFPLIMAAGVTIGINVPYASAVDSAFSVYYFED